MRRDKEMGSWAEKALKARDGGGACSWGCRQTQGRGCSPSREKPASPLFLSLVKYERIKFLVIALKNSVEVYAWAPKPYHKFMAFKVTQASTSFTGPRSGSSAHIP